MKINTKGDAQTGFINSGYIDILPELDDYKFRILINYIWVLDDVNKGVRRFIIDELKHNPEDYGFED